jgi:hypothetical protein
MALLYGAFSMEMILLFFNNFPVTFIFDINLSIQ